MAEGEGEGGERFIIRAGVQVNCVGICTADTAQMAVDLNPFRTRQFWLRNIIETGAGKSTPQQRGVDLFGNPAEDITGDSKIETDRFHSIDNNIF
jgi:hypothetical protein